MLGLLRILAARQAPRHPTRLGLMTLSIALAVAAWTAARVLDRTLDAALRTASSPLGGQADAHVSRGDAGVPRALVARLAGVPGVRAARPLLIRRVLLTAPSSARRSVMLVGVELAAERDRARGAGLTLRGTSPAALARAALSGRGAVAVGEALAAELPARARALELMAAGRLRRVERVGVVEARGAGASLGGHVVLTDLATAGRLLDEPERVTRIDLTFDPNADPRRIRAGLAAVVGDAADVLTPEAHDARVHDALEGLRIGFSLCGAGALGLALLLAAGAFAVGVAERQAEVGLLRALGAERAQVGWLFAVEAGAIGLAGAVVGLPLGWGLAALSCGPMLRVLGDVFVPLEARGPVFDPATAVGAVVAGMATTLLAALVPTARTVARAPLATLSNQPAWTRRQHETATRAAVAAALLTAALTHAAGDTIGPRFRVFATLVAVMVGVLLAIPLATALAGRLLRPVAEAVLGLPGRLAADRMARHPAGSGIAMAALAGSMALILQTGGVIHGNEEAIRAWVDQSIAGDLFVTSGGPLSASGQTLPMRATVGAQIEERLPGARAVAMSFHDLPWSRAGRPTRLLLLALDARRYEEVNRDRRPPLPEYAAFRRLVEPGTAIISENLAALDTVAPGDTITLPGAAGPVPLRVVGTTVDYSCSRGVVLVDRVNLGAALSVSKVDVFSVTLPRGVDPAPLAHALAQAPWAADQALVVLRREELRAHILGMVGRLHGVAAVQEAAAALVAALGVTTALLISVLQRRRELGLLRAVGATPAQACGVVLAEAGLMAVGGIAFGLVIGTCLEWYVVRVVLFEETGFLFPVRVPWTNAVLVAGLMLGGSLLAGSGPALRASRLRLPEALACD